MYKKEVENEHHNIISSHPYFQDMFDNKIKEVDKWLPQVEIEP